MAEIFLKVNFFWKIIKFLYFYKYSFKLLIYKGIIGDLIDTPDPYISVDVSSAATKTQKTKYFNNCVNPKWDEELLFLVPPVSDWTPDDEIVVSLMDKNYSSDEVNSRGKDIYDT